MPGSKKRQKTTEVVTKSILSQNFNSRAQMDLIDFQSLPDGEYKCVMVYQDHFSKFVQIQPLKYKAALEVANGLVDIFRNLTYHLLLNPTTEKSLETVSSKLLNTYGLV